MYSYNKNEEIKNDTLETKIYLTQNKVIMEEIRNNMA